MFSPFCCSVFFRGYTPSSSIISNVSAAKHLEKSIGRLRSKAWVFYKGDPVMYLLYFYSVTSWQYATESQRVKKSGERQTRHLNVGLRLLIHIHILRPYYRHQHLCSGADVNSLKPESNVVLASNDDEGARIYNNNNLVKLEEYGHKIKNYYFKFQTNIRICFIIYRTGECILVSEWVGECAGHSFILCGPERTTGQPNRL